MMMMMTTDSDERHLTKEEENNYLNIVTITSKVSPNSVNRIKQKLSQRAILAIKLNSLQNYIL